MERGALPLNGNIDPLIAMNIRLTRSFLAASFALAPLSGIRAADHMTDGEKAAAIITVGAFAAASAHARGHDQGPDYRNPGTSVTVSIYNAYGEQVPVYLYPRNGGWFGPRGEFYRTIPSVRYLSKMYGSQRPGR